MPTNGLHEKIERRHGKIIYCGKELPPGPWHDEPDHVDFEHAGLACILHRGPVGAWCGYVGVQPGHPWHGKDCDSVRSPGVDNELDWPNVHGGLTYASKCQGPICHVPKPGESDDVWWLGFDCIHCGDLGFFDLIELIPGMPPSSRGGSYRDLAYVRRETESLAEQARAAAEAR